VVLTANAVIFDMATHEVQIGAVDVPELGPADILVKAGSVGLCRSDNELLEGHLSGHLDIPDHVVPGHEWSGTVVAVGESVTTLSPGDMVVGECVISDGHWFGFTYSGAAAEQFVVPSQLLHRVPAGITLSQAALIEPFTIAYNAFVESGGCDASDVVTVIGGGMVGLCALTIARAKGATVVLVEPNGKRQALAQDLGADVVLDPADIDDYASFYSQFGGISGANLVIEASGHPAGISSTFRHAAFRGRITNIGICPADVTAPVGLIQAKNLVVRGVTGSTGVWPAAIRFMQRSDIDLSAVISSEYDYTQAAEAMTMTDTPESTKVHLTFS
jgi:L-iditol 2-dehydrogenase